MRGGAEPEGPAWSRHDSWAVCGSAKLEFAQAAQGATVTVTHTRPAPAAMPNGSKSPNDSSGGVIRTIASILRVFGSTRQTVPAVGTVPPQGAFADCQRPALVAGAAHLRRRDAAGHLQRARVDAQNAIPTCRIQLERPDGAVARGEGSNRSVRNLRPVDDAAGRGIDLQDRSVSGHDPDGALPDRDRRGCHSLTKDSALRKTHPAEHGACLRTDPQNQTAAEVLRADPDGAATDGDRVQVVGNVERLGNETGPNVREDASAFPCAQDPRAARVGGDRGGAEKRRRRREPRDAHRAFDAVRLGVDRRNRTVVPVVHPDGLSRDSHGLRQLTHGRHRPDSTVPGADADERVVRNREARLRPLTSSDALGRSSEAGRDGDRRHGQRERDCEERLPAGANSHVSPPCLRRPRLCDRFAAKIRHGGERRLRRH